MCHKTRDGDGRNLREGPARLLKLNLPSCFCPASKGLPSRVSAWSKLRWMYGRWLCSLRYALQRECLYMNYKALFLEIGNKTKIH